MIDEKQQLELRAKYNPEGSILRNAQMRMLDILKIIDGICKKHNIQYWLSSGTCLGAVRHGGFIPWDDDVDIEMMMDDYKRLIPILRTELPEGYILHDFEIDKNYPYPYAKVRNTNSYIDEASPFDMKYYGLFVDIFPLEKVSYLSYKISRTLYNRLCYMMPKRKRLFIFNHNLLCKVIFPILRFFDSILSDKKSVRHTLGMPFKKKRYIKDIYPLRYISFEDTKFPVPNNYHKYLERIYGDYMKLPDEIHAHGIISQL